MNEQPNALKGIKLRVHSINKREQVPNKPKQPKSECKCLDCNLPELESDYEPPKSSSATKEEITPIIKPETGVGLTNNVSQPLEQPNQIAGIDKTDSICPDCGKEKSIYILKCFNCGTKPEQPNTELLIVKTIQGLMSAASRELTELNKMVSIAKHKVLIDEVLEDITSTERNSLFELQKAFE